MLEVCVDVQTAGQRIPLAELNSLSCILGSVPGGQLPLSVEGASPSLLRVLSDARKDDHQFILSRNFTEEVFLGCYGQAHQEVLGMMEVTATIDYLMLRLRGALREPWLEDAAVLRRCVVPSRVSFNDLRDVAFELIPVWNSVREFVRYTGPRHIKSETDILVFLVRSTHLCDDFSFLLFLFLLFIFFFFRRGGWEISWAQV